MSNQLWTALEPPATVPPPVAVRGMPGLARSDHPSFPELVPYARESLARFAPDKPCASPEAAGRLARDLLYAELGSHPVLVLKHFDVQSRADFSRFVGALGLARHGYEGGVALRDQATDGVTVASTEPPAVVISPHNENSYMPNPPAIVMFHCFRAATRGGEIPINDVRKIPPNLPAGLIDEVRKRQIRYLRRAPRDNSDLEIGWPQQFGTEDKSRVEAYLDEQGIHYHWDAGDVLRYWFNRSAFLNYRGKEIWFNQISESNAEWFMCHPVFRQRGLTREQSQMDTAFGDGEPFGDETTASVRGALWHTTELVKLEPGDIVVLDNFIMQHGRLSYEGERLHHAALIKEPLA